MTIQEIRRRHDEISEAIQCGRAFTLFAHELMERYGAETTEDLPDDAFIQIYEASRGVPTPSQVGKAQAALRSELEILQLEELFARSCG